MVSEEVFIDHPFIEISQASNDPRKNFHDGIPNKKLNDIERISFKPKNLVLLNLGTFVRCYWIDW